MKSMIKKILGLVLLLLILYALAKGALLYFGIIHFNDPDKETYPVRGVDVSHYQGDIDWKVLSAQGISFAYIKATEGREFVDPKFEENMRNASEVPLRIGAYHFFNFDATGSEQAEHFRETVEPYEGMLPPVVDVEYYGDYKPGNAVDAETVKRELRAFIDRIGSEYGMLPVIYATGESYEAFLKEGFEDCDLWYRSVYFEIGEDVDWKFWQFSNRHVLKGYEGDERYIDMNVFNGDADEFLSYPN